VSNACRQPLGIDVIPSPFAHRDEPKLHSMIRRAAEHPLPLQAVLGIPPGWADPKSRALVIQTGRARDPYRPVLLDDLGFAVESDVQLARALGEGRDPRIG
jgi:hypothetical protein